MALTEDQHREILDRLDPNRYLVGGAIGQFYVDRDPALRTRLTKVLSLPDAKVFLWGQSGSGKSTELARLDQDLDRSMFSVGVEVARFFDLADLTLAQIFVAGTFVAMQVAKEQGVTSSSETRSRLAPCGLSWVDDHPKLSPDSCREASLAFVRQETAVALHEIEAAVGRPVILLYDGLEKLVVGQALGLFATNGEMLAAWPARALFVVPPLAPFEPEWLEAERHAADRVFLRALPVADMGVPHCEIARQFFRDMATRRLATGGAAIASDVLDLVISFGGGIPRQFLQVLRDSFLDAMLEGLDSPNATSVEKAGRRLRDALKLKLTPKDIYDLDMLRGQRVEQLDQNVLHLVAMDCVIQYESGGKQWYGVNPLLSLV